MEELLKNSVVRSKIQGLSPPVKKAFIESLLDLYEQETEEMIDVIEESRMELRGDYRSFQDETQNLRAESRMLEDKRKDHDNQCVDRYVQSRASRVSESRMSYVDENSKAVKDYIKKRGKKGPPLAEEIKRSHSQTSDRYSSKSRPDSVMTTRSLPTPATLRTVEEEKDEVMKNLSSANQQNEVERQRQAELIAQRREKRRNEKKSTEEKALELLEKAVAMDKMLQERKQEQEQLVRQRLEDAKRKRAESRIGDRADTTLDLQDSRDERKYENKAEDRKKTSESRADDRQKHRSSESQDQDRHRSSESRDKDNHRNSRGDSESREADRRAQKTSENRAGENEKEKRKSSDSRDDKNGANDKRSESGSKSRSSEKRSEKRSENRDRDSEKRHSSGKSEKRENDKGKENDKKKESVSDYDFSIY